jgi:hypothetical protein
VVNVKNCRCGTDHHGRGRRDGRCRGGVSDRTRLMLMWDRHVGVDRRRLTPPECGRPPANGGSRCGPTEWCHGAVDQVRYRSGAIDRMLIPQVRQARKYPNSPWETIHSPGEIMQYVRDLTRSTRLGVPSHSQPLINTKYQIQVTNTGKQYSNK